MTYSFDNISKELHQHFKYPYTSIDVSKTVSTNLSTISIIEQQLDYRMLTKLNTLDKSLRSSIIKKFLSNTLTYNNETFELTFNVISLDSRILTFTFMNNHFYHQHIDYTHEDDIIHILKKIQKYYFIKNILTEITYKYNNTTVQ
tara:strand:- start:166 stop:600 length:435 start_codon:yes stop_codon:yes gene_type:complete